MEVYRIPLIKNDPMAKCFNYIRNKFGQEFLDAYNEWSKIDAGSIFYLDRLEYFFQFDKKVSRYKKYLEEKCSI